MKYTGTRHETIMPLADVLEYVYTLAIPDNGFSDTYHLAPNLEMMVVFSFGSPISSSFGVDAKMEVFSGRVLILGPIRQMLNYELNPGSDLLVFSFINDGYYRLASSFSTHNDLVQELELLWEALDSYSEAQDRINILNEYLITTLCSSAPEVYPLLNSIPDIHNPAVNPVDVIAKKAAVSGRTIQLRFKKYTGYSSKELLRYLRFKHLITWIVAHHSGKVEWMDMVVKFGYHDQSHLIKDFKYYTGFSPGKVLKMCREKSFCLSRD